MRIPLLGQQAHCKDKVILETTSKNLWITESLYPSKEVTVPNQPQGIHAEYDYFATFFSGLLKGFIV